MQASTGTSPCERDNHFNFLRLLLAAFVLLGHAPEMTDGDRHRELLTRIFPNFSFGSLGVIGFFLLSGFLIVQSWQRQPVVASFLRNRVLRIYPGYVVAALVSVFVFGTIGAIKPGVYLAGIHPLTLLEELVLLHTPSTPLTFFEQFYPVVNGSLWTISFEFGCYLCVALLGVCGLIKRPRAFLVFTLLITGAWMLVAICFVSVHGDPRFNQTIAGALRSVLLYFKEYLMFLYLLNFFCAGGCFALFRDRVRFSPWWAVAGVFVLAPCMYSVVTSQIALLTLGAYAFFTLAFARLPVLAPFKGHTDISYGVYLYGWPAQKLLLWSMPDLSPWMLFVFSAFVSAALGWISWRLVELPCLQLKRRPLRASMSTVAVEPGYRQSLAGEAAMQAKTT